MNGFIHFSLAMAACLLGVSPAGVLAQEVAEGSWRPLFNGRDLTGWTQLNGNHVFEARNGEIVGSTVPGEPNGFLVTNEEFGDFILELEVRVDVLMNNSGIQFRSRSRDDYRDGRVHGYQAEIDTKPQRWSGSIYDEARRGWLYILELNPQGKEAFVNNAWNRYRIEAIGTSNRVWVNGIPTAHLVDDETTRGFIGLQLHANNPDDPSGSHQIRFRNIRIRTENLQPSSYDDIFVVNLIPNHVSGQERHQGFSLLWDGSSSTGWTVENGGGWRIDGGALRPGDDASDLVSEASFGPFELKFAFKPLSDDASCGVHYFVSGYTGEPSRYCRMASERVETDRWNHGIIRARADRHVEYWLNGFKILEYRRTEDQPARGHIVIDHRSRDVAYQSIKIRSLEDGALRAENNAEAGTISVFREGQDDPIVTQHARPGDRPYIHPIMAPDGNGVLTQYRPEHHPHQTGLYWGLKQVNGRDYFMQWQGDHYRRVAARVTERHGERVQWRTVYDLLDENGEAVLTETQDWSMRLREGKFVLDLEWTGEARKDVVVEKFYVGGLFLRMPWRHGIHGDVVDAAGRRNEDAEGQRAIWADIGMQIDGRSDLAHIAIFDHPDNDAFPVAWRVDGELGVGPSRQILGDWHLRAGEHTRIRYRLVVYTGERDPADLTLQWIDYAAGS